jgi:predicted DNA-binding antitoxin AbrB/MazE fold protein
MSERIEAVFENGIFRPQVPVTIAEGQRVSLNVEAHPAAADDLSDVQDLLDHEFMESCRKQRAGEPSLEDVRRMLSGFDGSLADRISDERDER